MFIKKIYQYYADELEADVIVSDGNFELLCYALYCENFEGDTDFSLLPFGCRNVMTNDERVCRVIKLEESHFAYKLQGKLIDINDRNEGTIQIGSIIIDEIKYIPKDIKVGEYIECDTTRIDICKT